MDPDPVTTPISEDADVIVRVPVLPMCRTLPYYPAEQRWIFHCSVCPTCAGDGCFPCPVGGALAEAVLAAREAQHETARWN